MLTLLSFPRVLENLLEKDGGEEIRHVFNPRKKKIKIGNQVTIGELAGLIGIKASDILKKMMEEGTLATINQAIPGETAALLAADFVQLFAADAAVLYFDHDLANIEGRHLQLGNG